MRLRRRSSIVDTVQMRIEMLIKNIDDSLSRIDACKAYNRLRDIIGEGQNDYSQLSVCLQFERILINKAMNNRECMNDYDFKRIPEFHSDNKNTKECVICLDTVNHGKILTCFHVFHEECIRKWVCEVKAECPLCKNDLKKCFQNNQ